MSIDFKNQPDKFQSESNQKPILPPWEFQKKFWLAIKTGELTSFNREELVGFIDAYYFSEIPMTELKDKENQELKKFTLSELEYYLKYENTYATFLINHFSGHDKVPEILYERQRLEEEGIVLGHKNFHSSKIVSDGKGLNYGIDKKYYEYLSDTARKNLCKNLLEVLDVGGYHGKGLFYLQKDIDPNIRTTNFTMHPEPIMFRTDDLVISTIERFPAKYYESFDLVFCNKTLRHTKYPKICLINILKSLKPGGVAYLDLNLVAKPIEFIKIIDFISKLENSKTILAAYYNDYGDLIRRPKTDAMGCFIEIVKQDSIKREFKI